ncbi:site-specific integrase [Microvirga lenta]|uniref:site-specific integrase n=1 Tax=Microvirga lenta TaxID=2881337 RepID=UPI001CFF5D5A|nr:site-specific integrase [Microvirga lenta]MCB5177581.1 site-specific integrase [Microvirga lenta]
MNYLKRHPKTGVYIFRRAIPVELRPFFGRGREWTESLKTKKLEEAKGLVLAVAARVEGLFQQAREQAEAKRAQAEANVSVTVPMIVGLVRTWKEHELSERAQAVMADPLARAAFDAEVQLFNNTLDGVDVQEDPKAFWANADRRDRFLDDKVREITVRAGLLVTPSHPAWMVLYHKVQDAWREILTSEGRWRNLEFASLPSTEPQPYPQFGAGVPSRPANHGKALPRLSEALEHWAAGGGVRGVKKPAKATVQEARAALKRFIELHGDLPIDAITRAHGREFRNAIARVPRRLPTALASLPLSELLSRDLSDQPSRSAKTLNKSLTLLGAVLSRAERDGYFDGLHWRNPFEVAFAIEGMEDDGYEPFTEAELNKLLASPVFAAGVRPTRGRGCTAKWAPLVALFHGARRGEVLQLFVRDVARDAETGIWTFQFNRDADKSIKTASSIRHTPLHPQIVDLGFLDFVEQRRRAVGDGGSLWPGFEDRGKLDSRMNKWGEWFGAYLSEHVVDAPTKAFHSFRATFKRFGHASHVPEPVLDRLVGHVISGVGAQYGKRKNDVGGRDSGIPLPRLAEEIAKIRFKGVLFDQIR